MADSTISNLPASTGVSPTDDVLPIVHASTTQKVSPQDIVDAAFPQVPFTPTGNISATTVAGAINELDSEKDSITSVDAKLALKANTTALPTAMDSATAQTGTSTTAQTVSASVLQAGVTAGIGNTPTTPLLKYSIDTMVGNPSFTVNDKSYYYKTTNNISVSSSQRYMIACQNGAGLYYTYDCKYWRQTTAFSPFTYSNPAGSDYITCDYGTATPYIISLPLGSTNTLSYITPLTTSTIATVTLPVTTTFYKPVYISGGVALIVPKTSTNQVYILYGTTIATITLPYTAVWQEPTALYFEDSNNAITTANQSIALITDGTHLIKISATGTAIELTGTTGSIVNIAATKKTILVETTTTAFIASYTDVFNSTGSVIWKSPSIGYTNFDGANYYILANSTHFVRIGSSNLDFLNVSTDGLNWRFIPIWPWGNDQPTLREGALLTDHGYIAHCDFGHVIYNFFNGARSRLNLTGWLIAGCGSNLIAQSGSVFNIEGYTTPIPTKTTTSAPATGTTVTLTENCTNHIITTTGTLANLTVTLPPNPYHSQAIAITFTCAVTSLTLNASTIPSGQNFGITAPLSAAVGTVLKYIYNSSDKKWYPC